MQQYHHRAKSKSLVGRRKAEKDLEERLPLWSHRMEFMLSSCAKFLLNYIRKLLE